MNNIPTLPSIQELLNGREVGELTDVYTTYPLDEAEKHNLDNPEKCRCFPEMFFYAGEDGRFDMLTVDHVRTI